MSRRIVVLARNTSEANTYSRRAGLPRFTYTAPAGASSVHGLRNVDVHVLPGFRRRADRFAILSKLRHAPGVKFMQVEMPPAPDPVVDQGDGMGQQLTLDELYALNARVGHRPIVITNADEPPSATTLEVVEPTEEPRGEEAGASEQSEDPAPPAPGRKPRPRAEQRDEELPADLVAAVSAGFD